jgi:beta-glucosidase
MTAALLAALLVAASARPPADPIDARAAALVARMTLAEKIGQLTQFSSGQLTGPGDRNATLERQRALIREGRIGSIINVRHAAQANELQHVAVEQSRLGVPLVVGMDVIHGYRTIFPIPLGEASSWDLALMEKTAAAAAAEMAADGIRWTFAPMVDVGRDARWGRVAEGAGEDAFLGAKIAAARVRGFQGDGPTWRVMATAKHFAAYGGAEAGRDYASVDLSETTLRTVYLPPFRAAVDAGVGSIMSSFNEIAGVPSTGNRFLLTDVLRGEWGYRGLVVSDWGSVSEMVRHGYVEGLAEAAAAALHAGCDVDMCTGTYMDQLEALVKAGVVPMREIDAAVTRVLRAKLRLGLFEHPYVDESAAAAAQLRPEARELARQAARESIVLRKNEGELLPLPKTGKRIAFVGPFVDAKLEALGCWWARGRAEDVVTLLEGVRAKLGGDVPHALGTDFRGKRKNVAEAVATARAADVVVLFVGDPGWNTGENNSKTSLELVEPERELVRAIVATGKPIVLVLMNGAPMALAWEAEHAAAVLETWALGVESGHAIADVLFGDEAPGGKLPITFPRVTGQVPIHYDHKRSGRPPEIPGGSHYTDSPADPLWTFGHGLSYTKFVYDDLRVTPAVIARDGSARVEARITNAGARSGVEVAQLYVHDVAASLTRPVKELRGFERITLAPGESRRVSFTLGPAELGMWNARNQFVVEPGEFRVWIGTSSAEGLEGKLVVGREGRSARPISRRE